MNLLVSIMQELNLKEYEFLDVIESSPISISLAIMHSQSRKKFLVKLFGFSTQSTEQLATINKISSDLVAHPMLELEPCFRFSTTSSIAYWLKEFIHDGNGNYSTLQHLLNSENSLPIDLNSINCILKELLKSLKTIFSFFKKKNLKHVLPLFLTPSNIYFLTDLKNLSDLKVGLCDLALCRLLPISDIEAFEEKIQSWFQEIDSLSSKRLLKKNKAHFQQELLFCAPEVSTKSTANEASIIYSMGVITYFLLTQKFPIGHFPSPSSLRKDIPSEWDLWIMRCLEYDPKNRFSSFEECIQYLPIAKKNPIYFEEACSVTTPLKKGFTPQGMVYIPPGECLIGGKGCGSDALPEHPFISPGFYLDRTPVTNKQFLKFVEETGYITEAEQGYGAPIWKEDAWVICLDINWRNPYREAELPDDFLKHPVTQITWKDAEAYAKWRGNRLPTEKEWEYAARAGLEGFAYPWGNQITKADAHFDADRTCRVMSYPPNKFGLYDMIGNVWEWTSSFYERYPNNIDNTPYYGDEYRILRGGAYLHGANYCLIAFRNANQPDRAYPTLGFRTARDI